MGSADLPLGSAARRELTGSVDFALFEVRGCSPELRKTAELLGSETLCYPSLVGIRHKKPQIAGTTVCATFARYALLVALVGH
jgi:hypothetical protein